MKREEEQQRRSYCRSLASPASRLLVSKMQFVSSGRSLWIYTLLFTHLQLCASKSPQPLPAPKLDIRSRSGDSVVLVCQVPEGNSGVLFTLYRFRETVDSVALQADSEEVLFTVSVKEGKEPELFCCSYKHQDSFSIVSPYLKVEHRKGAAPTRPVPSLPPPVLSVEPSGGMVERGDMLYFSCSPPVPPPQSPSQSTSNKPAFFVLLRTASSKETKSSVHQPQAIQASVPISQPGVFPVGPVRGGEDGQYTCLYQITRRKALVNSTVSNMVQVFVKDVLPVPTLVLQQQTQVWHLVCTGSPAYPGAVFSLYLVGNEHPVSTRHAEVIKHEATFSVPVQDAPVASYQCEYSVLLGRQWSNSEHSLPLAVSRGAPPPSAQGLSGMDWPLVLGSFSAAVLFLCSVTLLVVVTHRKVKAAAEKKKKRQDAKYWTPAHVKDQDVDNSPSCTSFPSQEWASGGAASEAASRSPLWNPLSTFTAPVH